METVSAACVLDSCRGKIGWLQIPLDLKEKLNQMAEVFDDIPTNVIDVTFLPPLEWDSGNSWFVD